MRYKAFQKLHPTTLLLILSTWLSPLLPAHAQATGEPLLEVPVYALPEGMTFEDYEAANLRITTGVAQAIVPGGVHFYGKDNQTGWILAGTSGLGLVAMMVGAAMSEEFQNNDPTFETVTLSDGNLYEKIPFTRTEGADGQPTNTEYGLRALPTKQVTSTGAALLISGGIAIFGSYLYDIFHGIKVIEHTRNQARFKYGQLMQTKKKTTGPTVSIRPILEPTKGQVGIHAGLTF